MEVQAVAKYIRVQPRKVRIVADEIKGKSAHDASAKLRFHPSKGARMLRKVIDSAVANAEANNGLNGGSLRIRTIMVDEGPKIKRMTQKAMGRGARIIKKTSHITVILEDFEQKAPQKPHGTKAKPRPKFEAPKKAKAAKKEEVIEETPVVEATEEVTEEVAAGAEVVETAAPEAEATEPESVEAEATEEKKD